MGKLGIDMDKHAVIDEFVRDLRYCAENGLSLELNASKTRQLARALEDYDFDENRRVEYNEVANIIRSAVSSAVFSLDDTITFECMERIFGEQSEVHR